MTTTLTAFLTGRPFDVRRQEKAASASAPDEELEQPAHPSKARRKRRNSSERPPHRRGEPTPGAGVGSAHGAPTHAYIPDFEAE